MVFWMVAVLALIAVASLLVLPLWAKPPADAQAAEHPDLGVYRAQLAEIDRDQARGTLAESEAASARLEVQRRLLDADRKLAGRTTDVDAPRGAKLAASLLVGLLVIGGGLGTYMLVGAPGFGDLPIADRLAASEAARAARPSQTEAEAALPATPEPELPDDYRDLMTQLRGAVANRPTDLQGHELLARNEANIGNFTAAYAAQAQVIAIKGEAATAEDHAQLADLMIAAAGGQVSPEAEGAISKALGLDPENPLARFLAGRMFLQLDRYDRALTMWRPLASGDPNAPWTQMVRANITAVAQAAGERYELPPPATPSQPGPTAEDIGAAAQMSAEDRASMVESMVSRLSERLATEGGPPEDWARLIGALGVLGRTEQAQAIATEARGIFADNPEAMAQINAAAGQPEAAQ